MTASFNSNVAGSVSGNRQNLAYIGEDNRIYVLDFPTGRSNPWSQWDILTFQANNHQAVPFPVAGINAPRGGCPLALVPWEPGGINGLAYIGNADGQNIVVALTLDMPGIQVPNAFNLTQLTNTQHYPPLANSPLAAYIWQKQQSLHAIYVDSQGHVRELYRVGAGRWYSNDLSANAGYTGLNAPRAGSPLAGYVWENQGTEHVFYIAGDNTIRELYYTGKWNANNLSASVPSALPPLKNSPLAAYVCEYENTQHVIYLNENGDVQELYYSGDGWKTGEPLNQTAGASKPAVNSALIGYAAEYEHTEHVVYIDDHNVMHELYRTGNEWLETLLLESAGSGATAPRAGTPLAGYAYIYGNVGTQHVIYVDVNNNIHELYREGNAWFAGVVSASIPVSS